MPKNSKSATIAKKPIEGNAFSFDIGGGRCGIGVFSRVETARPRKPYGVFIYYFGPFPQNKSLIHFLPTLRPKNAIARLNGSALGFYSGYWKHIGTLPDWNRNDWPLPDFYERDHFTNQYWRVRLSEFDLAHLTLRESIKEPGDLQVNSSHGSISAVNEVIRLLEGARAATLSATLH